MDNKSQDVELIFSNYKIPKKTEPSSKPVANYSTPLKLSQPVGLVGPWSKVIVPPPPTFAPKRPLEKQVPKQVKTNNRPYRDSCPDRSDETLPKELTSMFQPLFCKLCQAHLNSNVNAMLHYKSKNHEKRIRNFLVEYAEKTGEPLHKRAKLGATGPSEQPDDPRYTYCETCDLQLTSRMHAEQHYMGRNHQKALVSKKPAGSGYYDEDGKWHRTMKPKEDSTGRNGIGMAFAKPSEVNPAIQGKFYCTVCLVSTTSNEHLEIHYAGQKHQKALRKLGMNTASPDPALRMQTPGEWKWVASCRTPSGQYYCQPCNLSLNSEAQFVQHLDSKKHLRNKAAHAAKKTETSSLPSANLI